LGDLRLEPGLNKSYTYVVQTTEPGSPIHRFQCRIVQSVTFRSKSSKGFEASTKTLDIEGVDLPRGMLSARGMVIPMDLDPHGAIEKPAGRALGFWVASLGPGIFGAVLPKGPIHEGMSWSTPIDLRDINGAHQLLDLRLFSGSLKSDENLDSRAKLNCRVIRIAQGAVTIESSLDKTLKIAMHAHNPNPSVHMPMEILATLSAQMTGRTVISAADGMLMEADSTVRTNWGNRVFNFETRIRRQR